MGKTYKFFKHYIIKFDLFGQPLRIYLNKNHKYRSIFGGVLSLIIIIFLLIIGLNKFVALFYKFSPNILESNVYLSDPGPLELKKNGFMFAFGFPNELIKEYNNSLFQFDIYYNYQKRNLDKNTLDTKKFEIKTEFCTEKHFPNHENEYNQIKLYNYLCPSLKENNLTLHGGFHNQNFKYLKISIKRCNATKNICLSDSKLQEIFSTNFYFEFYIINNDIEIQNHKDPIKQYIKSDIHFLINPLTNIYKTTDIFLSELEIIDKYNPFALSKDIKNISTYIFKEEKREQINLLSKPSNTIADFNFRKSYYKYSFTKTYGDAFSILSYLGGLGKSLVIIIGYFASKYNNHSYLLKMSNFLFSFPDDSKKNKKEEDSELKKKKKKEKKKMKNIEYKKESESESKSESKSKSKSESEIENENESQSKSENESENENESINENQNNVDYDNNNEIQKEKSNKFKSKINEEKNINLRRIQTKDLQKAQRRKKKHSTTTMTTYLLQKVTDYLDSLQPLKPLIKDVCTLLPFGKKYEIRKKKLKRAKKAVKENLNLGTILLKMQELDRLKKILLTDDQNKVFSFFPKPNIFYNESNDDKISKQELYSFNSFTTKKLENYHNFSELLGFVSDLQNSNESNMLNKEINEKLVNLILNEVKELISFTLSKTNKNVSCYLIILGCRRYKIEFI